MNTIYQALENRKGELPKKGSIEYLIEKHDGFKPGTRKAFDEALMKKDRVAILKLLPTVPKEYKKRFAQNINKII